MLARYITCLIVEDDKDDQDIFLMALEELGEAYQCIFANNGREALSFLRNLKPDCIFVDINMPGLSGIQCLQEIKKQPSLKEIPVAVYTTASAERYRETAFREGASAFFTKPGKLSDFIRMLQDYFNEILQHKVC